ncbi:MAG: GvpL/GvpF family gas vesicle protein [Acidobacteriia bacterium]|nr:GvpL/GvpF family gas vesicle protein [Terriglobia bacterium]
MSYLLYCILRSPVQPGAGFPRGVGGKPVFVMAHDGLSVGLSEVAESDAAPDISEVLAYEAVVEHWFRDRTVIPVRYGCRLEDAAEVRRLLERHCDEYGALLNELENMAEMGIQVLLDHSRSAAENHARPVTPKSFRLSFRSGAAYLAAKRQRYQGLDRTTSRERRLAEELCDGLSGLFVRRKLELPETSRGRLPSLYFLVPRASVEAFRKAVRQLGAKESRKLLLSGPWPPYNFVDSLEMWPDIQTP